MPEELTLLPCPLCQARAHVECHNGKFRVICKGESGCPFRMGGKRFVFPDECYDWWNAMPRALEWTTEPPKVPGWYWFRNGGAKPVILSITLPVRWKVEPDDEWAGPIPEPREPKE